MDDYLTALAGHLVRAGFRALVQGDHVAVIEPTTSTTMPIRSNPHTECGRTWIAGHPYGPAATP